MLIEHSPQQSATQVEYTGQEGGTITDIQATQANVLTEIYQPHHHLAVWQRQLPLALEQQIQALLETKPQLQTSMTLTADNAFTELYQALGASESVKALAQDMANLVEMFCCLFELERVALRLTALTHAMCPRFHVDQVPCRLVTTYQGVGTQWLSHAEVDRSKLGKGNQGLPDHQSGLYGQEATINQQQAGDVILMKGERWQGNEGAGVVHRSPAIATNENRLLMTLDFSY